MKKLILALVALFVTAALIAPQGEIAPYEQTTIQTSTAGETYSHLTRASEDGLFPGTYYFYDNMKAGSPSDPNGDGNPDDGVYSYSSPWEYKKQDETGYWQATNGNYASANGQMTTQTINLPDDAYTPIWVSIGVVFNMPSANVKFEISINGGGYNELETFSGDSNNYPGNSDGAVMAQYDISSASGGTVQLRWTYATSGVLPSQGLFIMWPVMIYSNEAPYNTTVTLEPRAPASGDDITVSANCEDRDNDTIQYKYEWYRNDELVSNMTNKTTLPSNMTVKDDIWKCVVTPFDGQLWGAQGWDQIQVGNAPPTTPVITITPEEPTTEDDLTCTIVTPSTDPDGQNVTYIFEWYLNGVLQSSLTDDTVPHELTAKGESWSVSVRATDGNSTSGAATFTVFIGNLGPKPPTSISPEITADTMPIITWFGASDPDGDVLKYSIQIGNTSGGSEIKPWTSTWHNDYYQQPTPLDPGTYYVQVKVTDGLMTSAVFESEMVINPQINNSPPYPPVDITPSETKYTHVNLSWLPAVDPDGTPLTYNLTIFSSNGTEIQAENGTNRTWLNLNLPFDTYKIILWSYDGELESGRHVHYLKMSEDSNDAPTPPSGMSPHVTSDQSPIIKWNASTDDEMDPIKYYIQIGTTSCGKEVFRWRLAGVNTTYKVPTLLDFGTYYVQLRAYDGNQYSRVYEDTMVIFNTPPTAPSHIKPDSTPSPTPTISWLPGTDNETNLLFYYIKIASSSGDNIVPWTYVGPTTYYTPEVELKPGNYTVSVLTSDGIMNSTVYSEELTITTNGNWPPQSPRNLRPLKTSLREPELVWDRAYDNDAPSESSVTYRIAVGSSAYSHDVLGWTDVNTNRFSFKGMKTLDYGIYYVSLTATDGIEESQIYMEQLTVEPSNHAPYAVSDIHPRNTYTSWPIIYWSPTIDPDGDSVSYTLTVGHTEGSDDVINVTLDENYYQIPETHALGPGDYYIGVQATDGSLDSSIVTAEMTVNSAPLTPQVKSIYPLESAPGIVSFWWYSIPSATYTIWLGTAPFMDDVITATSCSDNTFDTPNGLDNGTYYVSVQAWVDGIPSAPITSRLNVSADAPVLPHLSGSITSSVADKTVTLAWPSDEGCTGYHIIIGDAPFQGIIEENVSTNTLSVDFEAEGLDEGNYSIVVIPIKDDMYGYPLYGWVDVSFSSGNNGGSNGNSETEKPLKLQLFMVPDSAKVERGQNVEFQFKIYNLGMVLVKLLVNSTVTGIDNQSFIAGINSSVGIFNGVTSISETGYVVVPPGSANVVTLTVKINTQLFSAGSYNVTITIRSLGGQVGPNKNFSLVVTENTASKPEPSGGSEGGFGNDLTMAAVGIGILLALIIIGVVILFGRNKNGGKGKNGDALDGDEWIPVSDEEVDDFFDEV